MLLLKGQKLNRLLAIFINFDFSLVKYKEISLAGGGGIFLSIDEQIFFAKKRLGLTLAFLNKMEQD